MDETSERPRIPPGQGVTKGFPVLHVGAPPPFDPATWRLRVHGSVARPFELSWEELRALPATRVEADAHCVTGWSRLDNVWEGVLVRDLVERAGALASARFVRFADAAGYDTSVPLATALAADVLLAWAWEGRPLTSEHGAPLRSVVPALYLWKSCKWVREVELLDEDRLGFWEVRGYHNDADPWREERFV